MTTEPPPTPPTPPVTVQHVHHHYHPAPKQPGIAVLLEVLPGLFQVFGIGHIYAGNVATGLCFMFGYWVLAAVNFVLVFLLIGWLTWPLCWLATLIISSLVAARSCNPPQPVHYPRSTA